MNHKPIFVGTILITIALTIPVPSGFSQTATDSSSLDPDVIKENVRKRIQEVVNIRGEQTVAKTPVAYTGTLLTIANDTLTIETQQGIKLASISAQTSYAMLPDDPTAELDDISLEDHVIALGFINGSDVMDARRVISQKTIPQPSAKQVFYGIIDSYDPDSGIFVLTNPVSAETRRFTYGRLSDVTVKLGLDEAIDFDDQDEIPPNTSAIIITTPPSDDESDPEIVIDTMVIKQLVSTTIIDRPATSSAQTTQGQVPPELRR